MGTDSDDGYDPLEGQETPGFFKALADAVAGPVAAVGKRVENVASTVREWTTEAVTDTVDVAVGLGKMFYEGVTGTADTKGATATGMETDVDALGNPGTKEGKEFAAMAAAVKAQMQDEWAKAGNTPDGREKLITKWATKGVLNIAAMFIGAAEIKAAAKAYNLSKGRSLVTVAELCEEAARAGKGAEDAGKLAAFAKRNGFTKSAVEHAQEVARREGVIIEVRPATKNAPELIEGKGFHPKPEDIKAKTINADDIALGAPAHAKGQVAFFKEMPDGSLKGLHPPDPALKSTDPEQYERLLERYNDRLEEAQVRAKDMAQLEKDGEITVANNGLVKNRESGAGYTGDNDLFDIRNADGSPMDPAKKEKILQELKDGDFKAQHGEHMGWDPKPPDPALKETDPDLYQQKLEKYEADQKMKQKIIDKHTEGNPDAENLAVIGPDGVSQGWAGGGE